MLLTRRFAGAVLALALLAGIPLSAPTAVAADAPCAEAGAPMSGDGCCGDAGANVDCVLDCAVLGGAALPLASLCAVPAPQHGDRLAIQTFTSATFSGPPETAPPKAS